MPDAASVILSEPLTDRHALEAFAARNPELEQLERLLGQFNIFEALGAARQELRHSDFLAFLLNPKQNHGLGASFLKTFLQEAALAADSDATDLPVDLDAWTFEAVEVRREWGHIDVLVIDERARFVVLIENKIDTGEGADQLARYYQTVQQRWPGYAVFALYLTPEGAEPSDLRYQAVGYELICRVVEEVAESAKATLDQAVHLLMTHYAQMLRKHIVSDSHISALCRSIYSQHRQALDLIYKHRPDRRSEIREIALRLLSEGHDWKILSKWKSGVSFRPHAWQTSRLLWGIVYCAFDCSPTALHFSIQIWNEGTDPADCRNLWEMSRRLGWPVRKMSKRNTFVYDHYLLQSSDAELEGAELEALIQERWTAFLNEQYPVLREQLRQEKWLWDNDNETSC